MRVVFANSIGAKHQHQVFNTILVGQIQVTEKYSEPCLLGNGKVLVTSM